MKKILLFIFMIISTNCYADTKISAMTLDSSPTTDNLTVEVDDPSGTPVNKKITLGSISNFSGFSDNGSVVNLLTQADNVGLGTFDPITGKLVVMNGNVGIGTLNPTRALTVFSSTTALAKFEDNSAYAAGSGTGIISIYSDNGTAITGGNKFSTIDFGAGRDTVHTIGSAAAITAYTTEDWSGSATGSRLDFETTNNGSTSRTARMSIANQNVGIGTGNPQATLAIIKSGSTPAFQISSVAGGGGDYFKVDSTGNVGIGSTAAGQKLDVQGTVRITGFVDTTSPTNGYVMTTDANGAGTWQAAGGSSQWATQNTTDVSLAAGNVGIGTTFTTTSALTIMNGNVGIGTWKPQVTLAVKGNMVVGNSLATAPSNGFASIGNVGIGTFIVSRGGLELKQLSDTNTGGIAIDNTALSTNLRLWVDANAVSRIDGGASGTTQVTINGGGTGNVGVGTTMVSAAGKLIVIGGNVGIGTITPGSALDITGGMRVFNATSPWTVKTGANTACNTTCGTTACALGEDTGVVGTIVACTDATADVCVCMGP